ncbi:ABR012Cp [Eremothecium gossypii ATCC 10895]|uniref:Ribosome assembly factor mrt4 n=1 Tax=Eremothecium gossypii (strain ATCC 10895 / CBS 109.51 / FGSC 9923 / NRRL Y-1056) TaxID=284811 RepID=MRT4_EREGS|nr:mRNA turnover protein MRT4 [Eremothecium gossypii ATCC 10895]Q75DK9.1 RecName: Full=Ribosome assembly factor mrt4; AltName: Full=mRNA turnover protein 4 [Eremothecium gossypii ATCC 10895]AAS50782.1 ABR012Cp [Eremothecium gossypii ATCC 10895]AEY95071.1 FABR012Cp [Eremothecium gossypii FDAG1]
MPRSKRSKLVTLAQTEKKGRENKERIFDEVRQALDTYRYVWVLRLEDVRTPVLQEIRSAWAGSKLIMGRRKVLEKALGGTRETEYKENVSGLVKQCEGMCGLLFTDETPETVTAYFREYRKADYSRAKSRAPLRVEIPAGVVYSRGGQVPAEDDVPMVHSLEPTLRNKFKMPTRIQNGKITLEQPYLVCEAGETLDVRQALILKQFGVAAAEFRVKLAAYYDGEAAAVEEVRINME